jgi:hypothetical protein
MSGSYEVLSPWAEVDAMPMKGVSSPLPNLAGKKIGLFFNSKRSTPLIMAIVEQKLRERFPTVEFSRFDYVWYQDINGTPDEARLTEWVKGVDAVVSAVGD